MAYKNVARKGITMACLFKNTSILLMSRVYGSPSTANYIVVAMASHVHPDPVTIAVNLTERNGTSR